jgi:hypothetical protein
MNKCKTCGKNCGGEYCFSHKPRKKLKMISSQDKDFKQKLDNGLSKLDAVMKMWEVFYAIWKKRPHLSEVSDNYLGIEPLSAYFHHILPKSKYPELKLIEENIILLTLDEHANVESDMYKYEEVNKRREQLITKYNVS